MIMEEFYEESNDFCLHDGTVRSYDRMRQG